MSKKDQESFADHKGRIDRVVQALKASPEGIAYMRALSRLRAAIAADVPDRGALGAEYRAASSAADRKARELGALSGEHAEVGINLDMSAESMPAKSPALPAPAPLPPGPARVPTGRAALALPPPPKRKKAS